MSAPSPSVAAASPSPPRQLPAAFLDRLRQIGLDCRVLVEDAQVAVYECDALTMHRRRPGAVVLPASADQVRAVLALCAEYEVPVVPRGAGTGLSGGVRPLSEGIVLSTARLDRILAIDPLARTATVEPGVRNLAISVAAAPFGLHFAPDPSSQVACSIGGNVAENSGGVHCLKYGLTLHNVLRVKALTSSGEPIEFGSLAPDAPGLDLMSVFVGSEGMFAVATEITVRLLPKARSAQLVMASFAEVEACGRAVAEVIAAGVIPAGLEMMDRGAIAAVEAYVAAGYDLDCEALLLCELDGEPEAVAEELARVVEVLRGAGALRLRVARDEAERLRFWSGRKSAFPAAGRLAADYYCMDGTVPRRSIGPVLRRIRELGDEFRLGCVNVFHAGDGNLHPLILFDANDLEQWQRAEAFGEAILAACVEHGGTITGEHGVGVEKLGAMCGQFSAEELETFHAVKRAFDPPGLLNPDKGIPTRSRCAEFGRMHVHRGELPFPDLPRF
jgi:glycolate oxidase